MIDIKLSIIKSGDYARETERVIQRKDRERDRDKPEEEMEYNFFKTKIFY